jgi:hypothetical protein
MANAERLGRQDLVLACQLRLAEIAGARHSSPLAKEFWTAVAAAEELATHRNGRTTRLSRTRQKVERVGIHRCIADLAGSEKLSLGFQILTEGERPEMTFEAIVLRHPAEFSAQIVETSHRKLRTAGFDPSTLR